MTSRSVSRSLISSHDSIIAIRPTGRGNTTRTERTGKTLPTTNFFWGGRRHIDAAPQVQSHQPSMSTQSRQGTAAAVVFLVVEVLCSAATMSECSCRGQRDMGSAALRLLSLHNCHKLCKTQIKWVARLRSSPIDCRSLSWCSGCANAIRLKAEDVRRVPPTWEGAAARLRPARNGKVSSGTSWRARAKRSHNHAHASNGAACCPSLLFCHMPSGHLYT
eukprot:5936392-Amphidinium_carterae.8